MSEIPTIGTKSAFSFLSDGYNFIRNKSDDLQTDLFQTSILSMKVICMRGEEQARLFYDQEKFQRKGAAPKPAQKTLFGEGGVQGLDDEIHRHRKAMFMSLMGEEARAKLLNILEKYWHQYAQKWEAMDEIILFEELQELIFQGVCEWSGIPFKKEEVSNKASEIGAMIDGAGSVGLRHFKGRKGRDNKEEWISDIIQQVRDKKITAKEGSPLHVIAWHRRLDGNFLDPRIGAVELLNIVRPTVAVSRFIVFAALALHDHPEYREKLKNGDDKDIHMFVQEVRRFYPFFPFVIAQVKKTFEWNGYHFPEGRKALLDLYGTNHDPKIWENPEQFRPERFAEEEKGPYAFIPQGGGEHHQHHRCPGEWITIDIMKQAIKFLISEMDYKVPEQDLSISLTRMPAIPKSRFIISSVKHLAESEVT